MKCNICKRDLIKGYYGIVYTPFNMFLCEECEDMLSKTGFFVKKYNEMEWAREVYGKKRSIKWHKKIQRS